MYGYYFLTELGMNRKYGGMLITPIQLIQFIIALSSTFYEVTHMKECGSTPWALGWMWFTYMVFLVFFLKLFFDKKAERSTGRSNGSQKKTQ
jgi:hypothetical protein